MKIPPQTEVRRSLLDRLAMLLTFSDKKCRTHKGSGSRMITLDMLREVGHLPQQQAANALKVGNTRFKTATRQLGMQSWPYRKIKSIRNLILVVQKNRNHFKVRIRNVFLIVILLVEPVQSTCRLPRNSDHGFKPCLQQGQAEEIIQTLHELENSVFEFPMTPLNDEFRKFRQAAYKLNHKRKAPTMPEHVHKYSNAMKKDVKESTISEFSTDQCQIHNSQNLVPCFVVNK